MDPEDLEKAIVTIDKETLAKLPAAVYKGEVQIIDEPSQLEDAIRDLKKSKMIGFDTETRPSFRKGQTHNVALIQLATSSKCYLFRVNKIGYPVELITLLEDPSLLKVGLSIHDDFLNLRRATEIEPKGFVDLQSYVKKYKIADNSLSRVYAILFGERISKGQRLSNWEAQELSEPQSIYAALDAAACIKIYSYLEEGKFNPEQSKYLTFPKDTEENPETQET